jgi:hypothetical protein
MGIGNFKLIQLANKKLRIYVARKQKTETDIKNDINLRPRRYVKKLSQAKADEQIDTQPLTFNPQRYLEQYLDTLTKNLSIITADRALDTLQKTEITFSNKLAQIPPTVKNQLSNIITRVPVTATSLTDELEISKRLENLRLNDIAIQRLVKAIDLNSLSNTSIVVVSRLLELRNSKYPTKISPDTIQHMNSRLVAFLKTPLNIRLLNEKYFDEQLELADLFHKNKEFAPYAKERMLRILEHDLSFFEQKSVYDYLKKNSSLTKQEQKMIGEEIIRRFKIPRTPLNDRDYTDTLDSLTEISKEIKEEASLCSSYIEKILEKVPNTTSNLLQALISANSLTPFRDGSRSLSIFGQHWRNLVANKLENMSSSLHNEHKLSKLISLLDLDLLNARRLLKILDKASYADEFHNIYQACLEHINKGQRNEIKNTLRDQLKIKLQESIGKIDLNEANLQESLKYINLFKPTENQDKDLQTLRKLMQINTAINFLRQAEKESSLGELLKLINKFFKTDFTVANDLQREISNSVLNLLERNAKPKSKSTIKEIYTTWHQQYPKIMLPPSVLSIN